MVSKVAPELEVFLDVARLRSGQDWQTELRRVIHRSDIFYLFWSRSAKRSKWVNWEWRCALQEHGLGFIDPVPLASPTSVPPPPELASKHFDDWVLAFMRYHDAESAGGVIATLFRRLFSLFRQKTIVEEPV
jgi:hypothetical protein